MKTAILKNIYRNGNKVPMMFRNGDLIYQMLEKLVFSVDTDALSFPTSGGSRTITITANDDWTMTIPEWLTASALSGYTGATITLTASATQSVQEGNIVISCGDKTHTITAKQEQDYASQYLTFKITSSGRILWRSRNNNYTNVSIQYSFDSGSTWSTISSTTGSTNGFDVNTGDVVMFKGNNTGYCKSISNVNCYNGFTGTTAGITIEGNIMSMLYGDNFIGQTTIQANLALAFLFIGISGLTDASNCILPATTLAPYCYRNMFNDSNNFNGAPKLPATNLAQGCYANMFMNCNALEVAPDLPAKTLVQECYSGIFYMATSGVKNLRYIKCLATNMSATDCLHYFHNASNISDTGVFVKYPGVSWTIGETEGIPTGWTVEEATE